MEQPGDVRVPATGVGQEGEVVAEEPAPETAQARSATCTAISTSAAIVTARRRELGWDRTARMAAVPSSSSEVTTESSHAGGSPPSNPSASNVVKRHDLTVTSGDPPRCYGQLFIPWREPTVSRKLGTVALFLGVFLLAVAALSKFYMYDQLAVVPLNQDTTSISETAPGADAEYLDAAAGLKITNGPLKNVKVVRATSRRASRPARTWARTSRSGTSTTHRQADVRLRRRRDRR